MAKTKKFDVSFLVSQIEDGKPESKATLVAHNQKGGQWMYKRFGHAPDDGIHFNSSDEAWAVRMELYLDGLSVEWETDDICVLCKHCDHFVEDNYVGFGQIVYRDATTITVEDDTGERQKYARYIHGEDGDQQFDHDAEPTGEYHKMAWFRINRPDLFVKHPDGAIGPNSAYHPQRGKSSLPDGEDYTDGEVLYVEDGKVIQWSGESKSRYTGSETLEEYGVDNLTKIERIRCGLSYPDGVESIC